MPISLSIFLKNLLLIVIVFLSLALHAQNIQDKSIVNTQIDSLVINGSLITKITLQTHTKNSITIQYNIEGENYENLFLATQEIGKTLKIEAKKQPSFLDNNDKLSAHKSNAIKLEITLPVNKNIEIISPKSNTTLLGNYNTINVQLKSGFCFFNGFCTYASIKTIEGNISITTNAAKVYCSSKNGFISKEIIDFGTSKIYLESVQGNISLLKKEL